MKSDEKWDGELMKSDEKWDGELMKNDEKWDGELIHWSFHGWALSSAWKHGQITAGHKIKKQGFSSQKQQESVEGFFQSAL